MNGLPTYYARFKKSTYYKVVLSVVIQNFIFTLKFLSNLTFTVTVQYVHCQIIVVKIRCTLLVKISGPLVVLQIKFGK